MSRSLRLQYKGAGSAPVPVANAAALTHQLKGCDYMYTERTATSSKSTRKSANGRAKRDRQLQATTPLVSFSGANYGGERTTSRHKQFLVARVNSATGFVELYDAEAFNLTTTIPGRKRPVGPDQAAELAARAKKTDSVKEIIAKRNNLTQEFGAKKKKQQLNALLQNRVDSSSLEHTGAAADLQSLLNSKAKTIGVPQNEPTSEDQGMLPPFNLEAQIVEECYPLDQLMSQEDVSDLASVSKMFIKASEEDIEGWKDQKLFSGYVLHEVKRGGADTTAKGRKVRAQVLALLDALLKFRRQRANKPQTGKGPIPESLRLRLVERFMVKTTMGAGEKAEWTKTNKTKDMLDLFIIVLALHVSDFVLAMDPLFKMALKVNVSKGKELVRTLGCKQDKGIAKLPLPLTFPKPKFSRS